MRKIVQNFTTFLIAIVGFLGGLIWAFLSKWDPEPIILVIISSLELISFIFLKISSKGANEENTVPNTNVLTVIVNSGENVSRTESEEKQKALVRILFIDDNHTDFKMVSILKKSGWINTKSVKDVADLDDPKIVEANIIFVDINGVGIAMFKDQGLGLAAALKKKYKKKKIVIYSSEATGDRFHNALREVDGCLSKNAEPYQFINLIESFSKLN